MGKTFRKEKTFKPKRRPLNNHRDLPDYQVPEPDADYPFEEDEAEEYYGKKLHPKERDIKSPEDTKTTKDN